MRRACLALLEEFSRTCHMYRSCGEWRRRKEMDSQRRRCTSVHVKREKNRRAISTPAPAGFRLPIRFVSAIASFFPASCWCCSLSIVIDCWPIWLWRFSGKSKPYRIRWPVYGWMVPITHPSSCRTRNARLFISMFLSFKNKIKMCGLLTRQTE